MYPVSRRFDVTKEDITDIINTLNELADGGRGQSWLHPIMLNMLHCALYDALGVYDSDTVSEWGGKYMTQDAARCRLDPCELHP